MDGESHNYDIAWFRNLAAGERVGRRLGGGQPGRLPENVVAGEPFEIGFMVRQHGMTPFEVDGLTVRATPQSGGKALVFEALPEGQTGHYTASLVFDKPGVYTWGISSGLYPEVQSMPDLQVGAGKGALGSGASSSVPGRAIGQAARLALLPAAISLAALGGLAWLARAQVRRKPLP